MKNWSIITKQLERVIKKIDDYGLALVKIEKIINPEREKIKITTKNNDKNVIFIFPDFFSE